MDAPVQQFAQPSHQQYPAYSAPAYSADLGDQLDLLSGGMLNSAPIPAPSAPAAAPSAPSLDWEGGPGDGRQGSFSSYGSYGSPWGSTQVQAGVSQEALERHAMLPLPPSSQRLSRRSSQVLTICHLSEDLILLSLHKYESMSMPPASQRPSTRRSPVTAWMSY